RPSVWWAIDTHLDFERCLGKARQADFTFAAQKNGTLRLNESGLETATWLPLACDPVLHGRCETPKVRDVCFIGNVLPGERQRLLGLLRQRYPDMLVDRRFFEEMAETYSASRTVFNRGVADDVNMRVFEALCSGSLLVTNALDDNGQAELFTDGRELATYAGDDELLEKLNYYLQHDQLREQIAACGRAAVLKRHTYRRRMETILATVDPSAGNGGCRKGNGRAARNGRLNGRFPTSAEPPRVRSAVAAKDRLYFEFDRTDVVELVPLTARRILDVGCGGGRLGAALKARQECEVVGIELDPSAAAAAKERLDRVVVGNVEEAGRVEFSEGRFDCVICADVLEHLREPADVLKKLRRWLTADGVLVTSLPNVRNHTVVQSLLAGNWTYESAGLLDADHVRFFTRREIEKLLFRAGFAVNEMRMAPGEGFSEWVNAGRPREVSVGGLQIRADSPADAAEFFAYQYLTRATPAPESNHGLTSIVIVTHGQLAHTKACVDSIRLLTDEPYELIFVDNGSTDGTVDYLRSLHGATVIANDSNRGFPAAVNQGMAVAQGEQILLLNNDCVVTTGWLRRMLDVLNSESGVGLVGPVSNNVSGEQQIPVGYGHLCELDGWAWQWGREHGHELTETDRLVGFCLLMKRELVDQIGALDERFGIGCFEDDDFCRRAVDAGYRAVMANGVFVHHVGSATFRASGVDLGDVLQQNQRLYDEKWGSEQAADRGQRREKGLSGPTTGSALACRVEPPPPPAGKPRPRHTIEAAAGGGLLLRPNTIGLSVCLIVRDNEQTIGPCLESIKPWVDEMVVVDTGSNDRTPEICEELGARVFHWAWQDNFAAARNVSIDHAQGEWLFWMDSDDTIPAECGRKLRDLATGPHPDHIHGYVVQVHCPGPPSGGSGLRPREPEANLESGDRSRARPGASDVTVVDHVKLFRNRPDLRFEFRIHEQLLPSIRRAGGEVGFTDIYVVHSGADHTLEGRQRKLDRDFRLLELELADRPDHPFVLFNLGMTHADACQYELAIGFLQRCITVSQPSESHLRKAYALLVSSLQQTEQFADAHATCRQGLQLYPDDKELLFRDAMLLHQSGRLEESVETYQRVLNQATDRHFTSVDAGIGGTKTRHNLAIVYEDLGRLAEAECEWRAVVDAEPGYRSGWRGLGQVLLKQGRTAEVEALTQKLTGDPELRGVAALLSARLAESRQAFGEAIAVLETGIVESPQDFESHNELCRLLFEHGQLEDAISALKRLVQLDPEDSRARHNLGQAYERAGEHECAKASYETALDIDGKRINTMQRLNRMPRTPEHPRHRLPQKATVLAEEIDAVGGPMCERVGGNVLHY
ncbi:MAG: glycosyltransferase, partial [Planctomycetota bacterium]